MFNYLVVYKNPKNMSLDSEIIESENGVEAINTIKRKYKDYYEPVIIINVVKLD